MVESGNGADEGPTQDAPEANTQVQDQLSPPVELKRLAFDYSGRAREYFGIWIVNLFLTIITLGIYSAWATVRSRRYLYGSFSLDSHGFGYHARPISILIGRALVVMFFAVYGGAQLLSPIASVVMAFGLVFLIPWAINRSFRFNMRNTSYRNVRFGFSGKYLTALGVFIGWPLLAAITGGLLAPFAVQAARQYIANNVSYGGRPFELKLPVGPVYVAMLQTILFSIALLIVVLIVVGLAIAPLIDTLAQDMETLEQGQEPDSAALYVIGAAVYAVMFFVFTAVPAFFGALVTNIVAHRVMLDGHRLEANFNPFSLAWISASNVVAVAVSLGLLFPWAVIRVARYRAAHFQALVDGDLDGYVTQAGDRTGAFGDEMANAFDIEIGIV